MHVVVYTDSAGIGGAEISLGHLVATASPDIHITVVGVNASVVKSIAQRRPQARHLCLPARGIAAFGLHLQTFYQLHPDIIHFNLCTPWAGAIGLAAALMLPQVRVVRVDQLPLRTTDLLTWLRTRFLCLRVDAHVAVGKTCGQRMEDFYALGRGTVRSIPNGVPDRGKLAFPPPTTDCLRVGSIGRLDAMKGHDLLLRAIAQVDRTQLVIWGEGAYRPALEQLATELGIGDRVELPGWIEHADDLSEFDVIVQPSRSEGFPLTMVEAMLAARPMIAADVGSVSEAIIDGKTGLLIQKEDVAGLVAALRRLRDDPDLRLRLGQQARGIAASHFTAQRMTMQYEQLWQDLLAQPQKPRLQVPRPRD